MKIHQNIWDANNTVLRGTFVERYANDRKEERSQINNLCSYLKKTEKEEKNKPKVSRKKEIKSQFYKIESRKTVVKMNKTKSYSFEIINKINELTDILSIS